MRPVVIDITPARIRWALAVYGVLLGLGTGIHLHGELRPDAGIAPERVVQLELATEAAREGYTPLLALSPPGLPARTADDIETNAWALPIGEDAGPYVVFGGVAATLGMRPAEVVRWAFVLCWALLVALAPVVFVGLFGAALPAVAAPIVLLAQMDLYVDSGLSWIPAWALLFGAPLVLLATKARSRHRVPLLLGATLVAGVAELTLRFAGLPLLVVVFLAAVFLSQRNAGRFLLAALVVATFLVPALTTRAAVERVRDARAPERTAAAPPASAKRWESAYLGLGYLVNEHGITTQTADAVARVQEDEPDAAYLAPDYVATLRRLYLDVWSDDVGYALDAHAAKAQELVRAALDDFGGVLLLVPLVFAVTPRRHRLRRHVGLILPLVPLTAIAPLAFLPTPEHTAAWLAVWGLLALVGFCGLVAVAPALARRTPRRRPWPQVRQAALVSLRNVATSASAIVSLLLLFVPLVLVEGPLAASIHRDTDRTFYLRNVAAERPALPAGGRAFGEWSFVRGLPQAWRANGGAELTTAGGALEVSTSPLRYADQLLAPERTVPRGVYVVEVEGRVVEGGITVSVFDADRGIWIEIERFWHGGSQGTRFGTEFTLMRSRRIQIVLTNFAPRDTASRWKVREVTLRRLRNAPIVYREFRFGPA